MIFLTIEQNYQQMGLSPVLVKVIDFLKENSLALKSKEIGVYELEGKDIFYQVIETETEEIQRRNAESHKEYLDVQFVVIGEEFIGITPWKNSYKVQNVDVNRDLWLYESVENEGYIHAVEGCVSIFYPEDIHKPQIAVNGPAFEKKVVVKVKYSLIMQ
ncbi:YhcH/YjgK/YiaL family protein [Peptoniphilus equinus]|uniref:YhcH/YjgK/YiaL family protein n=1 Tax=Peptoniphilus equinus TaxID=3016343 RepID=A0ABY7QUG9_9FIRM|nr:YhcH/YjgK/YiaL family protein [Peptoniphilus equinus]WBW50421.1 YhcH/YjgK/YiaL family protein [Peptoniphilus equinus]